MSSKVNSHLLIDSDTEFDCLERTEFLDSIKDRIKQDIAPGMIAICGDWGTGKTSAIKQLRKSLEDDHSDFEFVTVLFEAWRYQRDPNPIVPLIHEMSTQMATSNKVVEKFKGEGLALLRSLEFEFGLWGSKMKYSGEKHHEATKQMQDFTSTEVTRKALEATVKSILRGTDKENEEKAGRVVIFVDDLDRCEPSVMKSLLESIKIFLQIEMRS